MDVGASVVEDVESFHPLEPGEGAFDDPAVAAPFFAWISLESAIARDHSISPDARSRDNSSACNCSHTLARCHSSSRSQQVIPGPKPSSSGKCRHATPVCTTNKIPDSASRSGSRSRPG